MLPRHRLSSRSLHAFALAAPVVLAWVLHTCVAEPFRDARSFQVSLAVIHSTSAVQLADALNEQGYHWPPSTPVPRVGLAALPADMTALGVAERKAVFFRIVLPLAIAENERLVRLRAQLETRFAPGHLWRGTRAYRFVTRVARSYRVNGDLNEPAVRAQLLSRVDAVPLALVLAQAANESAWGTSRFAVQGNALFGQWTWVADAGLRPQRRTSGARHLVRAYPDLRGSVRAYLHNLNMGHAYGALRQTRARMRAEGRMPDAQVLAGTLLRYSERGEDYVRELREMIRTNGLDALGPVTLAPLPGVRP